MTGASEVDLGALRKVEAEVRDYLESWEPWVRVGHGEPSHITYLRAVVALLDEARQERDAARALAPRDEVAG